MLKDPLGAALLDGTALADSFAMRLNIRKDFIVPTVLRGTCIKFGISRNIDDVDPAIPLYHNVIEFILGISMTYSSGFSNFNVVNVVKTGDPGSKLMYHN